MWSSVNWIWYKFGDCNNLKQVLFCNLCDGIGPTGSKRIYPIFVLYHLISDGLTNSQPLLWEEESTQVQARENKQQISCEMGKNYSSSTSSARMIGPSLSQYLQIQRRWPGRCPCLVHRTTTDVEVRQNHLRCTITTDPSTPRALAVPSVVLLHSHAWRCDPRSKVILSVISTTNTSGKISSVYGRDK
jgi:hypothetical protein